MGARSAGAAVVSAIQGRRTNNIQSSATGAAAIARAVRSGSDVLPSGVVVAFIPRGDDRSPTGAAAAPAAHPARAAARTPVDATVKPTSPSTANAASPPPAAAAPIRVDGSGWRDTSRIERAAKKRTRSAAPSPRNPWVAAIWISSSCALAETPFHSMLQYSGVRYRGKEAR